MSRQKSGHANLVAMEAVAEASERMIDALRAAQDARGIVREHMPRAGGCPTSSTSSSPHPAGLVSNAIVELERTRHEAQRLLFQLLQAEGQSMTDIGGPGGSPGSWCRAWSTK